MGLACSSTFPRLCLIVVHVARLLSEIDFVWKLRFSVRKSNLKAVWKSDANILQISAFFLAHSGESSPSKSVLVDYLLCCSFAAISGGELGMLCVSCSLFLRSVIVVEFIYFFHGDWCECRDGDFFDSSLDARSGFWILSCCLRANWLILAAELDSLCTDFAVSYSDCCAGLSVWKTSLHLLTYGV